MIVDRANSLNSSGRFASNSHLCDNEVEHFMLSNEEVFKKNHSQLKKVYVNSKGSADSMDYSAFVRFAKVSGLYPKSLIEKDLESVF